MYKASQGGAQAEPDATAGGQQSASSNTEATDVDFEEVKEDKK